MHSAAKPGAAGDTSHVTAKFPARRLVDARQDRAEEVAALLASRQEALHRFAVEVLGPSAAPRPEEAGSGGSARGVGLQSLPCSSDAKQRSVPYFVRCHAAKKRPSNIRLASFPAATAFREWFLAQMAASDALLHQLRVGEDSVTAARHLHAAMEQLGLTAAELQGMGDGELVGGECV